MTPSPYQKAIYNEFQSTTRNINISAVAGSGKTTVLLRLLEMVPKGKTALLIAFNNSIVDELKHRTEPREGTEIMTIHSYGWRAIMMKYGSRVKMNPNKTLGKTEKALKEYEEEIGSLKKGYFFYIVPKVLDLMRCNLTPNEEEDIKELADYYGLDIGELEIKIIRKAMILMNRDKSQFDFTDMIYQPIVDSYIRFRKYDYIFCDESQDFSRCQQEIIRSALGRKGRLITVGDRNQAIYSFAGADINSYDKLATLNGESVSLPLSVCYRCSKNVVREAQEIVPEISYFPQKNEGEVKWGSLTEIKEGDWVLCRNLKPLIQTYLWLMKNKIKSKIKGKDIGEGVLALINRTGASTLNGMFVLLDLTKERLFRKLKKRGVKRPDLHPKMELLLQRIEVITILSEQVSTVKRLKELIENIFTDDVKGIMLSTIHKSKGLENERVFFLCPELIPSKFAQTEWEFIAERNLRYVAITRAKDTLIKVSGATFLEDLKQTIR